MELKHCFSHTLRGNSTGPLLHPEPPPLNHLIWVSLRSCGRPCGLTSSIMLKVQLLKISTSSSGQMSVHSCLPMNFVAGCSVAKVLEFFPFPIQSHCKIFMEGSHYQLFPLTLPPNRAAFILSPPSSSSAVKPCPLPRGSISIVLRGPCP